MKRLVTVLVLSVLLVSCDQTSNTNDVKPRRTLAQEGKGSTAEVPVIAIGVSFNCTPTRVWDGDGPIWCQEGPRVRLAGVAARELDETCRTDQPCPVVSGVVARAKLANLVGAVDGESPEGHLLVTGPTMKCKSEGGGKGSRTAAWCVSPKSGDLSCRLVVSGDALVWARYWHNHKC